MQRRPSSHRRARIYEGRAKILFEGPEPGTLVQHFKDEGAGFDGTQEATISGKGVLNNRISEYLFSRLADIGVPNHFLRRVGLREQLVREVDMFPIELVVRNAAGGDFAKRFKMEPGTPLPRSIIEYYYKSADLGTPMVSEEHITAFGWAMPPDLDDMVGLAVRVNDYLSGLFLGKGLRLIDFRLEFGRLWNEHGDVRILIADEISPDNCRLWDMVGTDGRTPATAPLDIHKGGDAYREVARRLGVLEEGEVIDLRDTRTSGTA